MRPLTNKNRKNRIVKKKKKKMFRYVKKDLVMTIKTPSSSRSLSLQEIPKRN